jgi:UTP-glucose-1-phosphate uridylyltransferase
MNAKKAVITATGLGAHLLSVAKEPLHRSISLS